MTIIRLTRPTYSHGHWRNLAPEHRCGSYSEWVGCWWWWGVGWGGCRWGGVVVGWGGGGGWWGGGLWVWGGFLGLLGGVFLGGCEFEGGSGVWFSGLWHGWMRVLGVGPMSQALNTQKGRVIEALFNHALRACRVNDRADGQHKNAWLEMKSVFDIEFDKSRSANFEFSTLSERISQISITSITNGYRSKTESIFPSSYPDNFKCALEGLAYAPARREIYDLLSEFGVIEKALALEDSGRYAREKIIERIAIAYLWGIDELEFPGSLISLMVNTRKISSRQPISFGVSVGRSCWITRRS